MSVGSPTAGTWSSSQWWPDNEFETDRFAERGVALSLSYDPTPSTPGGLLIVDNMLWGGRIFDAADRSAATEGVRALTRARPAVQSLPHRAARRIGRRSTRFRGPHRRPWPSPPGRSRRSGAPGGRETRRPRHGPVAGHASGTSPLMPAFHAVGCATPGGALTRWCVARGGGAARGAGWPGAREPDDSDVLQLSRSGKSAIGRVARAPSHAATSNSLWMN